MNEPVFSLNWWMASIVGVIFIFAGVQKFIARDLWPAQAKRLGAPTFAIPTVPYVEVVLGSLLIAGVATNAVLAASIVALSSFTVLLALRLVAGDRPPCACLSFRSTKPIGWNNIVRNLLMLALLVAALIRQRATVRVWIDQDLCTGDGLCVDHCPDVFVQLEDGIAYVAEAGVTLNDPGSSGSLATVEAKNHVDVVKAAEVCPGECIFIEMDEPLIAL